MGEYEVGGEDIFNGEAEGFEYGDLVVVVAGGEFAEFGFDMGGSPTSFGDSHDDVSSLFQRGVARVDDDARAGDERRIEFALCRQARADGDDVGAVSNPVALNDRRW